MTINATPRAYLQGINDRSRETPVLTPEQLPQHLPYLYLLTRKGDTTPQLVDGNAFAATYGEQSLDPQSPYATHQTLLAQTVLANANSCMIQRLKPADAKTSMLRVSIELIATNLPVYARTPDGSIEYTPLTQQQASAGVTPVPVVDETIIGTRAILHIGTAAYLLDKKDFAKGNVVSNYRDGSALSTDGTNTPLGEIVIPAVGATPEITFNTTSTLYPLFDLEVSSFGSYGDNIGIRLAVPTVNDSPALDLSTAEQIRAYLYRIYCVEKDVTTSTPVITPSAIGALYIDGTFKKGVNKPVTNQQLSYDDTFIENWETLSDPDVPPVYGPFGRMHTYSANFDAVLTKLTQGYSDNDATSDTDYDVVGEGSYDADALPFGRTSNAALTNVANIHLLNLFTGVDQNSVPYFSFDVSQSVYFGGISFTGNTVQYATGGSDGLVVDAAGHPDVLANLTMYDGLVQQELRNFGNNPEFPLLDMAKYPMSAFWDSGFSLLTKKQFLVPVSKRKDVFAVLSTQAVAEPDFTQPVVQGVAQPFAFVDLNDEVEEQAIATLLSTHATSYPESAIFGTGTCRVAIVGRGGELINSPWKGTYPLTIDLADKVSRYMGAGNGAWVSGQAFDVPPLNNVSMFKNVNITWLPDAAYNEEYASGLIWAQNFNRRSLFYPAFRTVYTDNTSVLNSLVTVMACCQLEKVAQSNWRDMTGNSTLTRAQFAEQSDARTNAKVAGKFDNRFTIVPKTTFTEADQKNGFSWTQTITIYANNMLTVGTFSIVSQRMSNLPSALTNPTGQ